MTGRAPYRILVADDEPMIRDLIRIRLRSHGVEVLEAVDGQEALDQVRTISPDLIVLDLMMPKVTGEDVLRHLQADPLTRRIPVIVITAQGELPANDLRFDNIAAYVTKPFSPRALAETILRLLPAPPLPRREP
jgi:CheY-like chemotaxis protein